MNVLVTGGVGYVGCSLIEQLIKQDDVEKIVVFDNLSKENYQLFSDKNLRNKPIEFVKADILDNYLLAKSLQDIDVVYHLAAKVVNPDSDADSHYFEQVNNWGSANVVREVAKSNVKSFIYLSSVYVYGQDSERKTTRDTPMPTSFYGISKWRGEEHVATLPSHINRYIIRSGSVYGHNLCTRFEVFVNQLLFNAHFFQKLSIHGEGNQVRPFIHINKLAESLAKIPNSQLLPSTYNLVEHNASVMDIVNELLTVYPNLEYNHVNRHIKMKDVIVQPSNEITKYIPWSSKSFSQEIKEFKENLW